MMTMMIFLSSTVSVISSADSYGVTVPVVYGWIECKGKTADDIRKY